MQEDPMFVSWPPHRRAANVLFGPAVLSSQFREHLAWWLKASRRSSEILYNLHTLRFTCPSFHALMVYSATVRDLLLPRIESFSSSSLPLVFTPAFQAPFCTRLAAPTTQRTL